MGFHRVPMDIAWMAAMVNYSLVAIQLKAKEPAEQLAGLLSPYHEQVAFQGVIGQTPVALCLGGLATLLGRDEDAERYFAEASDLNVRCNMRYAAAHTDFLWGIMLSTRG